MTTTTQGRVTSAHIHPAMAALLAARTADEAGDYVECQAQLTIAQSAVFAALGALADDRPKRETYIVPEDPASLVDTECCQ